MVVLPETAGLSPFVKPGSGVPSSPFPVQPASGVMPPLDYLPSISPPQVRVSEPEKSLAKRHKELVPALIKALKDVEPRVRDGATTALANLGSDAVADLIDALADKDKAVRTRAAMVLGQMGSAGRSAIPALIKALEDDDADVRGYAVRALAAVVDER
jgi:HEAT repeat protein